MDMFGLGILLNAKDQASASIYRVSNSLEELSRQLEDTALMSQKQMGIITQSIQATKENLDIGLAFTSVGSEFLGMSNAMISPLVGLGKQVVSTSSQFEQWRMTLKALYGDAEVATQKLQWGMNLAAQTPFDVEDVTQALIGFKAVGAEADTQFANASGEMRSFLEYMGDLAALRPDVGLQGVLMGVRNLLGGDGGKSLKMRMDIDLESILGRDFGSTTEEIMQDLVTVSDKLANGLMTELEGTWEQMISNLEDQSTRFFLAVGDGGAFEQIKKSLKNISDAIGEIDDDRMAKIGKNIASAMNLLTKPLELVSQLVVKVAMAVIKLIETSPLFSKLIVGFMGVVAGGTALAGVMLLLNGGFFLIKGALAMLPGLITTLKVNIMTLISTIVRLLPKVALWGSALALVYKAWKNDFGGIRTLLTGYMNNMYKAFSYSAEISQMGVDDMKKALADLDTTTFGGWLTYRLVQLRVLWIALVDAWNDNTLSDENFQKARELGLLPLIETILDCKARFLSFVEGFTTGAEKIYNVASKCIQEVVDFFTDLAEKLFPIQEGVDEVSDSLKNIDLDKWERFGEITAYIVSIIGGLFIFAKIVGLITTVGSALMRVVTFGTRVISIVGSILKVLGFVVSGIGTLVTVVLGFFGIAVSAPAWLVGAISLALVGIVALVIKHWDSIVEFTKKMWSKVCEYASGIGEWFADVWTKIKESAKNMWDNVVDVVKIAWNNIITFLQPVINFFTGLGQIIVGIFQIAWSVVSGACIIAWNLIKLVIGLAWEGIKYIIQQAYTFIVNMWNGIVLVFQTIWNFIYTNIISPVWNMIVAFIQSAYNGLVTLWQGIQAVFSTIWNYVYNNILVPIWTFITTLITNAYNEVVAIWNGIMNFFSTVWNYVLNNIISPLWNTILSIIRSAYNTVVSIWNGAISFFQSLWGSISSTASSVWNGISSFISTVSNAVQNAWKPVASFFGSIWKGIKDGAIELFDWLATKFSWVSDIAKNIADAWSGIKSGASTGWENIKEGAKKMVGLNTGGYVKTEGVAMLHPNEVVVNDDLTQKLRTYLNENDKNPTSKTTQVVQMVTPTVKVEMPDLSNVISLADYRRSKQQATVEPMVSNVDYSKTLTSNYANDYSRSLVNNNNNTTSLNTNDYSTNNEDIKTVYNKISNVSNVSNVHGTDSKTPTTEKVDNSITISEGAIQINMTNGNEQEIDALVKKLFQKIQRENELRNTLNYKTS